MDDVSASSECLLEYYMYKSVICVCLTFSNTFERVRKKLGR